MTEDYSLFHAGVYNPAKAREYYLRTRKLKGRGRGSSVQLTGGGRSVGGTAVSNLRPSRQKELAAQREALEKRLDTLRAVLAQKVQAAKGRSGVTAPAGKTTSPSEAAKSKAEGSKSDDKPLTEAQKSDKRKASKEQYEKEKGTSLSKEVQQLKEQIKDIRAKIQAAIEDARKQPAKSLSKTAPKDLSKTASKDLSKTASLSR